MSALKPLVAELPVFDRNFWDGTFRCTQIGSGSIGGKASGLVFIKDLLGDQIDPASFPDVEINVPTMAVIATNCFDRVHGAKQSPRAALRRNVRRTHRPCLSEERASV